LKKKIRTVKSLKYDLIVVGGSAIGFYVAKGFAEKGREVAVLEAKNEIGEKTCSGHYSQEILEFFPEAEELVKNETDGINIYNSINEFKHVKKEGMGYTMDRHKLDVLASEKAREQGVEVFTGVSVESVDGEEVHTSEGVFEASVIAGCDGYNSVVRDSTSIDKPSDSARVLVAEYMDEDLSGMCTCDVSREGFINCSMPKGDRFEYAVKVRDSDIDINELLERHLDRNGLGEPDNVFGGVIPLKLAGSFYEDNKFLVGDSAGQTKPFSGTGLMTGLRSAEVAVEEIDLDDVSTLEDYEVEWNESYLWDWRVSRALMYSAYLPEPLQATALFVSSKLGFGFDLPFTELRNAVTFMFDENK